MEVLKLVFDWTAAIAWPAAVLVIALLYRRPIYALLHHLGGIAGRASTQPFKLSIGSFRVDFKQAVVAKQPKNIEEAISAAATIAETFLPYGVPVPGQKGLVTSPWAPTRGYVDVRSCEPDTEVKDPYTGKVFRVPEF